MINSHGSSALMNLQFNKVTNPSHQLAQARRLPDTLTLRLEHHAAFIADQQIAASLELRFSAEW